MATQETVRQINSGGVLRDVEDAGARQLIASLQTALDALTSGDTTTAIATFNEVVAFLAGVEDTTTLQGIIAGLNTAIAAKVDKITGKGLSTEDFTTALKAKLEDLSNYDDAALQTAVGNLQTALENVYTKTDVDTALGGYVTTSTLDGYYTKTEIDNKGYLTQQDISGKADKSEMSVTDNRSTVTITLKQGTSATVLSSTALQGYVLSSSLAAVATSGSYNDLTNKPAIPAAQVQSDWNATSGMGVILNKPTNLSDFNNDLETPLVTVSSTGNVTQALEPNTFYRFGAIDSLALTLVAGTGTVVYFGRFTTSANWGGTGLTVPSGVTEGANNPTVEASKTYEYNIMDNVLLLMEV